MSCTGRRIATLAMTALNYRFVAPDRGDLTVFMTWPLQADAALRQPTPLAEG